MASGPAAPANETAIGAGLPAGTRLGRYEIARRIAVGGMAEIYLARMLAPLGDDDDEPIEAAFEKPVVLKRILPSLATQPEFLTMFLDEARIAAGLLHPNVVQVYDFGHAGADWFIAMELLEGEDLRSLARLCEGRDRRLPLGLAIRIAADVCAGLHYAHEKRGKDGEPLHIVHRDVSPQNVFVTVAGGVKLLDFGLARAAGRASETRRGTIKGKLSYMSPEQCRGRPLDRRSDVYSLGIVLYELTTGRRLYPGDSDFDVLKSIVEGRVRPPRRLDPGYPPGLEAIVMRALEKDRARRFQTARELQAALEGWAAEAGLPLANSALQEFMEREVRGRGALDPQLVEIVNSEARTSLRIRRRRPRAGWLLASAAIAALALAGAATLRAELPARLPLRAAPLSIRTKPLRHKGSEPPMVLYEAGGGLLAETPPAARAPSPAPR